MAGIGGTSSVEEFADYQRLTRLYREMSEAELIRLQDNSDRLTDMARDILTNEMSSRNMAWRSQPAAASFEPQTDEMLIQDFGLLAPSECVWEFAEREDAQAAGEMLTAEGLTCQVILPRAEKLDMTAPRVAVLPTDLEKARVLLSKPIPEEFRISVRTQDSFTAPSCSRCGCLDPLLESVEPVNEWRCEVCGNVWRDKMPE